MCRHWLVMEGVVDGVCYDLIPPSMWGGRESEIMAVVKTASLYSEVFRFTFERHGKYIC